MDHAGLVRSLQRLGDLLRDGQCLVDWDRSLGDAIRQRRPLDQFEHQRLGAFSLFQPVDVPDVGMVQRGEDLGFALEAGQAVGIGGEGLGQDFQRHVAVELRVAGAVDLPHPACANLGGDLIRAEGGAGL